jgi:hypothetical protein
LEIVGIPHCVVMRLRGGTHGLLRHDLEENGRGSKRRKGKKEEEGEVR